MSEITIQIPRLNEINQHIEVEVRINGTRHLYNYRVEKFNLDSTGDTAEAIVKSLREMIEGYDKSWKLFQIGLPDNNLIPVMFKQNVEG